MTPVDVLIGLVLGKIIYGAGKRLVRILRAYYVGLREAWHMLPPDRR